MLHRLSVNLRWLACAGGLSLLVTGSAAAQCAMCRASLAGDPRAAAASHQMNLAVLLLLIPATVIFCLFFIAIIRYRNSSANASPGDGVRQARRVGPVRKSEFGAGPLADFGENPGPGGF